MLLLVVTVSSGLDRIVVECDVTCISLPVDVLIQLMLRLLLAVVFCFARV